VVIIYGHDLELLETNMKKVYIKGLMRNQFKNQIKNLTTTLLLMSLFVFAAHIASCEELKLNASSVVFSDFIAKHQAEFEKTSGIKIVFVNDIKTITPPNAIMKSVLKGEADAGLSALEYPEWKRGYEKENASDSQIPQITYRLLGHLVTRIFTNPANHVAALSIGQVGDLLTGKTLNWKDLKGADLPVLIVRQANSKARETYFKKRVMSDKDFSPAAKIMKDATEIVNFVAKTPGSMGFLSEESISGRSDIALPQTPVIGRPIVIVTLGTPSERVRKFEQFYKSVYTVK
jgi:hypothetical protein